MQGRVFDRLEGGFSFASIIAFTAHSVWVAGGEISGTEKQVCGEIVPDRAATLSRRPTSILSAGVLGSLLGLGLGAQVMVTGAIGIAFSLGMSERVVGLTVARSRHLAARARELRRLPGLARREFAVDAQIV